MRLAQRRALPPGFCGGLVSSSGALALTRLAVEAALWLVISAPFLASSCDGSYSVEPSIFNNLRS